jgi:hypothetical protein
MEEKRREGQSGSIKIATATQISKKPTTKIPR